MNEQKIESKKRKASFKTVIEKNSVKICLIITVIAIICIATGFILKNPLIMILGLISAALYEAYRTWGITTKAASIILLLCLVLQIILIVFNINYDISKIIGISKKYISGYMLPLMDLKTLITIVIIFLSMILLLRTIGFYTKWLSIILIIGCLCFIYVLYPGQFYNLIKNAFKLFGFHI